MDKRGKPCLLEGNRPGGPARCPRQNQASLCRCGRSTWEAEAEGRRESATGQPVSLPATKASATAHPSQAQWGFLSCHDALLLRLGLEPQLDTALGPTPLRRLTPGPSSSLCSQGGLATHPPNPQTVLDIILGDEEKVALPLSERPRSILPALYRCPSLIS